MPFLKPRKPWFPLDFHMHCRILESFVVDSWKYTWNFCWICSMEHIQLWQILRYYVKFSIFLIIFNNCLWLWMHLLFHIPVLEHKVSISILVCCGDVSLNEFVNVWLYTWLILTEFSHFLKNTAFFMIDVLWIFQEGLQAKNMW